ncbi:MAG: ACT domain-containing protein [Chloroflexi bacterium]|nr:ACT domain-containing protein [Chloroflexota bacterium]
MAAGPPIKVGGIIETRELCLIGVMSAPDRPGLAAAIFARLGAEQLNVQCIVQSIDLNGDSHVQFCVAMSDAEQAIAVLRPVAESLRARQVTTRGPVSHLSVFGPDFRQRPGIAGTVFKALADTGVNILAVSMSISTISCVVAEHDHDAAIAGLRRVLEVP